MNTPITYVDLFSGAGGFALGLKQAGFALKKSYYSEIDHSAIAVYKNHFPKAIPLGSIEKVRKEAVKEKVDLLTFGFPCQDFSSAGQRKGFEQGKKSILFFEAMRLIESWKPRVFIFENVKGLFSADQGRAFEKILQEIARLGIYECQWQLCNTAWFLPQNRERIYFVATLRGETPPKIFPLRESLKLSEKSIEKRKTSQSCCSTITSSYSKGVQARGENYVNMQGWKPITKIRSNEGKIQRSKNLKKGIDHTPFGMKDFIIRNKKEMGALTTYGKNNLIGYTQYDNNGKGNRSQTNRIYNHLGKSPALTKSDIKIFDKNLIRRLTPMECERLQGFPDDWTKFGKDGKEQIEISETQRYKLMGNAVSVPVVKAVTIPLVAYLKKTKP